MVLSIRGIEGLEAAARAYAAAPRTTQDAVKEGAKQLGPELVRAAQRRAAGSIENAIAASGKTAATAKGLTATFGSTGSYHGTPLRTFARPWEWGGPRERFQAYIGKQRDSKRAMRVNRRTQRQIPATDYDGRFVSPAVEETTPRLAAAWADLIAEAVTNGG